MSATHGGANLSSQAPSSNSTSRVGEGGRRAAAPNDCVSALMCKCGLPTKMLHLFMPTSRLTMNSKDVKQDIRKFRGHFKLLYVYHSR